MMEIYFLLLSHHELVDIVLTALCRLKTFEIYGFGHHDIFLEPSEDGRRNNRLHISKIAMLYDLFACDSVFRINLKHFLQYFQKARIAIKQYRP